MPIPAFTLIAILATLLLMPLGHSAVILLRQISDPWLWAYANMAIGFSGFALIILGIKQSEIRASVLGLIGAHAMFVGFFEFGFALFAQALNVQPLLNPETGAVTLKPSLLVNEASFFILVPMFLLVYVNKQVRCNMVVWIRKQLRMSVGNPSERAKDKSYARITAAETLFIIWTIYAISLVTLDHRILGATHWLSSLIYCWFLIWPLYLLMRVRTIRASGMALRYAIPIGILLWSWVEMFASMGLHSEFYLEPLLYPVQCLLTLAAAAILLACLYRERPALPAKQTAI